MTVTGFFWNSVVGSDHSIESQFSQHDILDYYKKLRKMLEFLMEMNVK